MAVDATLGLPANETAVGALVRALGTAFYPLSTLFEARRAAHLAFSKISAGCAPTSLPDTRILVDLFARQAHWGDTVGGGCCLDIMSTLLKWQPSG